MNKHTIRSVLLGTLLLAALGARAEKQRRIIFNEDRGQHYMTAKTYKLKHAKAHNVLPYVLGAVKRFDPESRAQSLDYAAGNEQYLVVATGALLLPYIDQMIATLDYPSAKLDETGGVIEGDGIHHYSYCSDYRSSENMKDVLKLAFTGGFGSGRAYYDDPTNMFYWKSSRSQGDAFLKFLKEIDRPVPQMKVQLNVYMVADNYFRELGIDYVAWKNGPGAELIATGFDFSKFFQNVTFENMMSLVSDGPLSSATGLGAIMIAPQFDATFLRMLAQKGKARVATSAELVLVNDFTSPAATSYDDASYRFKFIPQYQNLVKDDDQKTSIEAADDSEFMFYVSLPIVCFGEKGPADPPKTLMCTWHLEINQLAETVGTGINAVESHTFESALTIERDVERLIAAFDQDVEVEQYNGIPFLGEIPVLKYLFGSESKVKSKMKVFVTMRATPVIGKSAIPAPEIARLGKMDKKK